MRSKRGQCPGLSDWWHRGGTLGSLQEVAQAAGWKSAEQKGAMGQGRKEVWRWLQAKLVGEGACRLAHTDPETLPDATTWYLVTNLPVPGSAAAQLSELEAASLQDVVRLYGLRM